METVDIASKDSAQKRALEKFYKDFGQKFGTFPDQKGVTRVIESAMSDKEGKFVQEFFSGRTYGDLKTILSIQKEKWKHDQILMANEAIRVKRFSLAEQLYNEMLEEGMVQNQEYLKFFNEVLEPAKKAHMEAFAKEEAAKSETSTKEETKEVAAVDQGGAVKDIRDYQDKTVVPIKKKGGRPRKNK